MPTTYDSVSGAPVYNFPTETKEDFEAINVKEGSWLLAELLAETEIMIRHWEAGIGEQPADDPRQQILVSMRELAEKMKAVVTPNSAPEASID